MACTCDRQSISITRSLNVKASACVATHDRHSLPRLHTASGVWNEVLVVGKCELRECISSSSVYIKMAPIYESKKRRSNKPWKPGKVLGDEMNGGREGRARHRVLHVPAARRRLVHRCISIRSIPYGYALVDSIVNITTRWGTRAYSNIF